MANSPQEAGRLAPEQVRAMFDRIAPRYDLMNRLMTIGLDQRWRRAAAAAADLAAGDRALDCCCGTGDLSLELAARVGPRGEVVGLDFSEEMLSLAREKTLVDVPMSFIAGDACDLPFGDGEFDAATVAFGARNVADLDGALSEMARVVRPGGRVVVLEISSAGRGRVLGTALNWFERAVPVLGRLVGRDGAAYSYLPASARRFPEPARLAAVMERAGLEDVTWRRFVGGLVALHHGRVIA